MTHEHSAHSAPSTAQEWDARYDTENLWSGNPNGTLVTEATSLAPGTALDVGCGEGADAVWLAQQGWSVTAVDVSRVAVERGRAAATAAGVEITWLVESFLDCPFEGFDLVSAQYPAITKTPEHGVEQHFARAVKPGGALIFVHHVLDDLPQGLNPSEYVMPADIAQYLGDNGWSIEVDEVRERHVSEGAGAHHTQDRVIVARKPPRATA